MVSQYYLIQRSDLVLSDIVRTCPRMYKSAIFRHIQRGLYIIVQRLSLRKKNTVYRI